MVWRAFAATFGDPNVDYALLGLLTVVSVSVLVLVTRRRGRALPGALGRWLLRVQACAPALVVMTVTMIAAGMEGGIESAYPGFPGWDFTPWIYAVEGHAVEHLQDALRTPLLDYALVAVYTAGAFLLYTIPFYSLVALGRASSALRVALTVAGIWAVGIVFYFLFPVYEVWTTASPDYPYHWTHVVNVYFEINPAAATSPAYHSAINNNFPSLHVALSVGTAAALWLSRERWLAIPGTVVAAGVTLATMYLGIHWVSDVVAGVALAAGSAWLAHRLVLRREARTRLNPDGARVDGASDASGS